MRQQPADLPFPVVPVSNGEWCPRPATAHQRLAARLIADECAARARRLGLTRAEFLRTAAATATAFMVLNRIHGLDASGDAAVLPVRREHTEDLAAADELLGDRYFVMDVQTHHVDLTLPDPTRFCFLRFGERLRDAGLSCADRTRLLGQTNFVKEVFVDSETDVGVISGTPAGVLLPVEGMAATRDLVNELARSKRALSQAIVDPRDPPGSPKAIDSLEHQVRDLKTAALKCYTYSGNWWLDDERVSYPMLAEASRLGVRLVNVHKGLPASIFPLAAQAFPDSDAYVHTRDLPKVARDWPRLTFCVYHSGYFFDGSGISEFVRVLEGMDRRSRRNIRAEIGTAFALAFLAGPDQAAHLVGQLLKTLGPRRILWGTDSVFWGSPQWLIDAFKALEIPPSMQEQFGYPPLTKRTKRRILGLNAARLYGIDPRARRRAIASDRFTALRAEQGGFRAGRSLRVYGPRTRREFLTLRQREERTAGA